MKNRGGFTLIELLVSLALTMFILAILAQAFVLGTDTFAQLKVVGDLNSTMRTAAARIRADLAADHFEGKRRLSDSKFYIEGPPQQGYFFLYQAPPGPFDGEAPDPDGLLVRVRTGKPIGSMDWEPGMILAFTVKARGNRPQDHFTAHILNNDPKLPSIGTPHGRFQEVDTSGQGVYFNSQWMEVCYFLGPPIGVNLPGPRLHALYRQQRLVAADVDELNWGAKKIPIANFPFYKDKVSCKPNASAPTFIYFNSPADLTIPARRTAGGLHPVGGLFDSAWANPSTGVFQFQPFNFKPLIDALILQPNQRSGEDLLLTDVLSFDVQVMVRGGADFVDLPYPAAGQGSFDTLSRRQDDKYNYANAPITTPAMITAVQIIIRVWDSKSQTTRQITVVQDM